MSTNKDPFSTEPLETIQGPSPAAKRTKSLSGRVAAAGAAVVAAAVTATLAPTILGPRIAEAAPAEVPATTAPDPARAQIQLRGDGLGNHRFGASEAEVTAYLEKALGKPTLTRHLRKCEIRPDSPWMKIAQWGDFWVEFDSRTTSKTAPRTLAAWGSSLDIKPGWKLQDDPPLGLTFAELAKTYPTGKTEKHLLDISTFTLPNQMYFVGDSERPDQLQAGEFLVCE